MATFLFAWNPKKWAWKEDDLTEKILRIAARGFVDDSWSCGNLIRRGKGYHVG